MAIVLHNYPPRNDKIGCAYGLDSFASASRLLAALAENGYLVEDTFDDPQKLAEALVAGLTSDQRWLTPDGMAQRAADKAGPRAAPGLAWGSFPPKYVSTRKRTGASARANFSCMKTSCS